MRHLLLLSAALLAPAVFAQQYVPAGEIQSASASASFDGDEVRGPRVQVTREDDGRWTGRLLGVVIDAQEVKNGLRGANFALYTERVKDGIAVRGHVDGRTVSFLVPDDPQQRFHRRWTLKGVADADNPPPAHFALAAVGALYGS